MASLIDSLSRSIFDKATLTYKQQIAPHTYHIRLQGEALRGHIFTAGEHLRLFVGIGRDTAMNSKVRTYSIWAFDTATGTADLAICTHSNGIGSRWIREVAVGEAIHYMGPKGKLVIDAAAKSHLLIGDASALSHLYAIRSQLTAAQTAAGILYTPDDSDHYADLSGERPFEVVRGHYDQTEAIIHAAERLRTVLPPALTIYLAGDMRICKSLGRHFREKWPQAEVRSKGFWMPGKVGLD